MSSITFDDGPVKTVEFAQAGTVQETFLEIYSGKVQKDHKDNRFSILPTASANCPIMYELCWYQSAINEINQLLTTKRTMRQNVSGTKRCASEALQQEGTSSEKTKDAPPLPTPQASADTSYHGATARPFRSRWIPIEHTDQFPYYAVTGSGGAGKSMFIKYYLDTLSRTKNCPDVLLVWRKPELKNSSLSLFEKVYLQLLYVAEGGAVKSVMVLCKMDSVPAQFWAHHSSGRPLQVIVEAFLPYFVRTNSTPVQRDIELFLYVASATSRDQGEEFMPGDADSWPFGDNFYHVSAFSREDYLTCGYACATLRTREFLREAADIKSSEPDIDTAEGRMRGTPAAVTEVMAYMYEVLGGTASFLLQFGDSRTSRRSATAHRIYESTMRALHEVSDGSAWPQHVRDAVNDKCAMLLADKLCQHLMRPTDVEDLRVRAISLFFHEVVAMMTSFNDVLLGWASASAAMTAIYLTMEQDQVQDVTNHLKFAANWSSISFAFEQVSLIALYRTLKNKGWIDVVGIGSTPAKARKLFIDAHGLYLVNMHAESDIPHLRVGQFAASTNANSAMVDGICIQGFQIAGRSGRSNKVPGNKATSASSAQDTLFNADGTLKDYASQPPAGGHCRGVSVLLRATTTATYDLKRDDTVISHYKQIAGASNELIMVFVVPDRHYKTFKLTRNEEQKGLRTYKFKCDGFW